MGDMKKVGFKPIKDPKQLDKAFNSFIKGPTGKFTVKVMPVKKKK